MDKLEEIKNILEEIYSIPFVAGEIGLGVDEVEAWRARLEDRLCELTGAQKTCVLCGQKGQHICLD